jgi:hypothetical protein
MEMCHLLDGFTYETAWEESNGVNVLQERSGGISITKSYDD